MDVKSLDKNDDIDLLLDNLTELAALVDQDDLRGLAQMHALCEKIAELPLQADAKPGKLHETARQLCEGLERIILDEVQDAQAALTGLLEVVASLDSMVSSTCGGDSADGEEEKTADDVAARLAKVFGDDDASAAPESEGKLAADAVLAEVPPPYESEPLLIPEAEHEFLKGFVEEAAEHIEAVEAAVLEVERETEDVSKIDDLFRPFHTIKGAAGFLNLRDINRLTHEVETLLDQCRKGQRAVTSGIIDVIFDAVDILKIQFSSIATYLNAPTGEEVPQPPVSEMIGKLREMIAGKGDPPGREPAAGNSSNRVGENLVEQGAVTKEAVDYALTIQEKGHPEQKIGEILVGTKTVTPKQVSQALRAQKAPAAKTTSGSIADQSIRIDTAKLDALVDMVGELVIAQTLVATQASEVADSGLNKQISQVEKIVRNVQDTAMAMRMIPIGATFQKMARLVRDVARKSGKKVELILSGEDTELDKTVIQQIGDPLVHMIRNAVDHGVESPQDRLAAGKTETGEVRLSAKHQGGKIVIEIADDGKGLDPAKLIAKGIERGVIQPDEELSDSQAYQLIFAPGFSMAAQVSDISGRGVGMDVVRRNIQQLRGTVEIESTLGRGSTFRICLPLTLAIIDGMVVRVGQERFIIPMIAIEQSLRPTPEQITSVQQRGEVLQIRGKMIPLVPLGQIFGMSPKLDPCETIVVIAHVDTRQIGVVVDELIGQQQVVIKTLGDYFAGVHGISGGAVLGDGRVGLILDMKGVEGVFNERGDEK